MDRELLSRPKAERLVGGRRALELLVKRREIVPVRKPSGRLGFPKCELLDWQERNRVTDPVGSRMSNADIRRINASGKAAEHTGKD